MRVEAGRPLEARAVIQMRKDGGLYQGVAKEVLQSVGSL